MQKLTLIAQACILCLLTATSLLAQDRPRIVAVNYALSYLAERLTGGEAEVVFPVPEGQDPSFWRPAVADISAIQSADLVLLNGAGFAGWVDRVSLRRSKVVNTSADLTDRYIATETITHSHGDGGEHSHEGTATYLWLDPVLAAGQADAIAQALIARGLADEADVAARLEALRADLDGLDARMKAALAGLQDSVIIATHPRYQYLARAYGLTILSLDWEAGAAPDATQLEALSALVAENEAKILIWEAAPPTSAFDATAALGLANVTLPPLAQAVPGADFIAVLDGAIADLAAASD